MAIDLEKAKETVTAELHSDHVTVRSNSLNKNISWPTFVTSLLPFLGRTAGEFDTIMPENVCYLSKSADRMFVSLYVPGVVRKVSYDPRGNAALRYFEIPFPNMIVEYYIHKGTDVWSVQEAKFFMTKETRQQTAAWYRAGMRIANGVGDHRNFYAVVSLPNIYEGGNMCTGENSVATNLTDNNLSGLDAYLRIMFDQPFSRDLSVRSVNRSAYEGALDWLETLHGRTTFPYEFTTLG